MVPFPGDVRPEGAEGVPEGGGPEDREDVAAAREPRGDLGCRLDNLGWRTRNRAPRLAGRRRRGGTGVLGVRPRVGGVGAARGAPSTLLGGGEVGVGCATANAVAVPTTISAPAGSPACSAIKRMRRAVTALSAERGASEVVRVDESTSSVPQSASGTWTLPLGVTGWPRTTRPLIVDVPTSPVAPAAPAAAPARMFTESTVISPAKTETARASITPSADDEVPCWAVALTVDAPTRRTEPSAGYANAPPPLAVGGAAIWLVAPPGWPGAVTWATRTVARVEEADGGDGAAAAMPATAAASTSTTPARAALTMRQGSVGPGGRPGTRAGPRRRAGERRRAAAGGSRRSGSRSGRRAPRRRPTRDRRRARPGPDIPVCPLPPRAHRRRRHDREQRRCGGLDLPETEQDERRDEENPAADAEQPGQDPAPEAEHERGDDDPRAHPAISQTPTTTRRPANASDNARPESRCCMCVPTRAPATAGTPTRAAYAGLTSPCTEYSGRPRSRSRRSLRVTSPRRHEARRPRALSGAGRRRSRRPRRRGSRRRRRQGR